MPVLALLLAAACVACDSAVTPPASSVAIVAASPGASTSTSASSTSPTPTPSPVPWPSYTSKLFRYTIKYPPGWVVTPGDAEHLDTFDNFTYPYIYVQRDDAGAGRTASVSSTVSGFIASTKSHYEAKVVSNKPIKLAKGYSGRIVTFTGVDHGVKVTIVKIFVAKGRWGYFIEMWSDLTTTAADLKIFKQMYTSWRPK